jgi:hypothetical protein
LNVTLHPTNDWIVQQLCEAFPLPCHYQYVLYDHDAKFGSEVLKFLKSSHLKPMRTSIRSPWQNGTAERWVGSARREMLDHIIPLNEYHLRRLGRDYQAYYHDDRTHIGLNKATPASRAVAHVRFRRLRLRLHLESAVFIIGTAGQRPRNRTGHPKNYSFCSLITCRLAAL